MPTTSSRTSNSGSGGSNALRNAFIRRSTAAIERMAELADEATLVEAMSASTDYGTLVRAMADVGSFGSTAVEPDQAAVNLVAEIAYREELERQAGGNLSADDVGRLLGITRQAVDKRRRAGSLLATRHGRTWAYPRAQFHGTATIPALSAIVEGLKASGPWLTLEFLLAPDTALDGLAPRDALLKDDEMRDRVLTIVRGYREGEGYA